MIRGTIAERTQQYRQRAVDKVTRSYAGEQVHRRTGAGGAVSRAGGSGRRHRCQRRAAQATARWIAEDGCSSRRRCTPAARVACDPQARPAPVRVYEWQGSIDAAFDVRLPDDRSANAQDRYAVAEHRHRRRARPGQCLPTLRVAGGGVSILQGASRAQRRRRACRLPAALVVGGRIAVPGAVRLRPAAAGPDAGDRAAGRYQQHRAGLAVAASAVQWRLLPRSHRIDGNGFHAGTGMSSSLASNAQAQYREGGDAATAKPKPADGRDAAATVADARAGRRQGRAVAGGPVSPCSRSTAPASTACCSCC